MTSVLQGSSRADKSDMALESDASPGTPQTPPPFPAAAAVLMAVSFVIFFQFSFGTRQAGDRGLGTFLAALSLTHLIGLLLLLPRQSRGVGAGIGFGAALAAVLPMVPFGVMLLVVMMASPHTFVLVPTQLVLLFVGFKAMRRARSDYSWILGIVLPILINAVFSSAAAQNRELLTSPRPYEMSAAEREQLEARRRQEWLEKLHPLQRFEHEYKRPMTDTATCLDRLKDTTGSYPRSVEEVRARCDAMRGLPARTRYLPARADANGNVAAFTLCVTAPWDKRFWAVTADNRGVWFQKSDSRESRACAAAWGDEPGSLLHCVFDYESKNPATGFPASLTDIGPGGTDCVDYGRRARGESVRIPYEDYYLTYTSDAPDADGRIAGFRIIGMNEFNGRPMLFVDQTGVWRATTERREARPDDPPWPRH